MDFEILQNDQCPYCGSSNFWVMDWEYSHVVLQNCECSDCGRQFIFQYELMAIFDADGRLIKKQEHE